MYFCNNVCIKSHQMYVNKQTLLPTSLGHSSSILDTPYLQYYPSLRAVTSWTMDPYYFHYLPSLSLFLLHKILLVNLILHLGILLYFKPTPSRRPTLFEIPYSVRLLQSKTVILQSTNPYQFSYS